MGKVATSSIFYRRGVPNNFTQFGALVQANYPIVQPNTFFINFIHFKPNNKKYYNNLYNNNKI